ncbi:MAG: sacsin N-terminal ATP-binding-like domain-containing protein [Streptosporangiaceae bacterium]
MREEFHDRIVGAADGVAELYLFGKKIDQPATREQKEFIEGIVATDYDGRTLIELLQNGHDAHPAGRSDGRLEFALRKDEGASGVLYVANGGNPVSHGDFAAMCRVAMSNKRPDEGIGNKGVGFKSVLQLADSPEVYSAAEPGATGFKGYCFRFARPADFDGSSTNPAGASHWSTASSACTAGAAE